MIRYAVRRKADGAVLPDSKRRKGYTHDEFVVGAFPRTFARPQDAKAAFEWWQQGKVSGIYNFDGCCEDLHFKPIPERLTVEIEIVPVTVTIGEPNGTETN